MKIDVTQFEGYADMTAEEKVALFESYEYEDNADALKKALSDAERYKKANSDANTQIAQMKREAKAKLSDDEKNAIEAQEELQRILNENAELKRDKSLSDNKAKFLSLGYDEELATKTATALVDGDMDAVFANQKLHQENTEKKLKADMLKNSPRIDTRDNGGKETTKKDFLQLNTEEQLAYIKENPDWKSTLK